MYTIIEYKETNTDISAGFVYDNILVYGSIGKETIEGLSEEQKYMELYKVIKHSLDYEKKVVELGGYPSILAPLNVDGIGFIPEEPKANKIIIKGDNCAFFEEGDPERIITLNAEVRDQYNNIYLGEVIWEGATNGEVLVSKPDKPEDQIHVTAKCEDIQETLTIHLIVNDIPTKNINESNTIETVLQQILQDNIDIKLALVELAGILLKGEDING